MALAFEQRRDNHAIGQFDASLFFFQSANPSTYAQAVSELGHYAKANDLPAPINRQIFQLDLGNPNALKSSSPQLAGWQRFASDGEIETAVALDNNAVHFTSRRYSTWQDMLPRIVDFFEKVGSSLLSEVPAVTKFQLNYQNQFRATSSKAFRASEVFRGGNGWIAPHVKNFPDNWHSNSGAFEDITQSFRRLINVNCSCTKQIELGRPEPLAYVDAHILVAQCYDVPNESPLVIPAHLFERILIENFDEAHSREKQVLHELISDDYLALMRA